MNFKKIIVFIVILILVVTVLFKSFFHNSKKQYVKTSFNEIVAVQNDEEKTENNKIKVHIVGEVVMPRVNRIRSRC